MNHEEPAVRLEPFSIVIEDDVLSDLRARIRNTRWPDQIPGVGWQQGTDLDYLRSLSEYWVEEFDWRAQEAELNRFTHFRTEVEGVRLHFVRKNAPGNGGIPLVLTHGWPSSFVELLPLVPLLTDPRAHGIDGPAFDVVIPSLPGYGFSQRPARTGVTTRYTAHLWHRLMQGLGYRRYGAQGGDFGSGVTTYMALDDPAPMIGIHLHNLDVRPYTGPGSRPLSEAELSYLAQLEQWGEAEAGYRAIQSTKPETVGYALNDSPVGLAAWILEKWRSWSDCRGDLEGQFSRDLLLTTVTLYWVTETIVPSIRDYYDNRWNGTYGEALGPDDRVSVPTGVALFDNHLVPEGHAPREWAERLYAIRRWTSMPRGGHFAPTEEPQLLAGDIAAFFGELGVEHSS